VSFFSERLRATVLDVRPVDVIFVKRNVVQLTLLMLQQDKPDDYVVATGEIHTIRDFLDLSFGHAGLEWQKYVEIDPKYYRPAEEGSRNSGSCRGITD
jgi:GDP-D-mannose dehydratase